ncbi:MAG TPA: cytochrome c [Acidimicrobiia bacterium]|jgi:cytochrome c oxidase subunit 2
MPIIDRRTALALVVVLLLACGGSSSGPQTGEELAADFGCLACHTGENTSIAPTWNGLFGSTVELDDGSTVVADEEYIRRSIVDPHAQIVAGYRATMPQFSLTDDEVDLLVQYIQGLGG